VTPERTRVGGDFPSGPVLSEQRRPARFPCLLFTIALFSAIGRGLLENLIGKSAAYAVQVTCVGLFLLVVIFSGQPRPSVILRRQLLLAWVFLLAVLLSAFATLNLSGVDYWGPYIAVMLFFACVMVVTTGWRYRFRAVGRIGPIVLVAVIVLSAVAILQQFAGYTLLPGSDTATFGGTVRPASTTGSFLHYPITLALLSFLLIGFHASTRRKFYLFGGLAGLLCVVASYSRSGIVIVVSGLALAVLFSRDVGARIRMGVGGALAIVVGLATLPIGDYVSRALSIVDLEDAGNNLRVEVWNDVVSRWLNSPLVVGVHAGEYTNVTANLSASTAQGVAESGLLQILISFGLFGVVGFYGLMFTTAVALPLRTPWYRAGLMAAILQSFFYQSIEVLPFMFVFAITPLLEDMYETYYEPLALMRPAALTS